MTSPRALRAATLTALVVTVGCASARNPEFGDQGLTHQRFVELDSTLGMHLGREVMLRAQQNVGQDRPGPSRPNVVTFHGRLLGLDEGWVHLGVNEADSVRIGKGSIVGVWLAGSAGPSRWPGAIVGALIGAGTAFGLIQAQDPADRPNNQTQVALIGGAGLIGGVIGSLIGIPSRRGQQLYPAPPAPRDTTRGGR